MLGACRKSENMELGRWEFEKSVQLDENCGRTYVFMENIYAAAGCQTELDGTEALRI